MTVKARRKQTVERKQEMQPGNTTVRLINVYSFGHSLQLPSTYVSVAAHLSRVGQQSAKSGSPRPGPNLTQVMNFTFLACD